MKKYLGENHPYDKWKAEYELKMQAEAIRLSKIKNPCVRQFGAGPEGKKCKTCKSLTYHQFTRKYYKCKNRPITRGPATDHNVGWDACGKYEEA